MAKVAVDHGDRADRKKFGPERVVIHLLSKSAILLIAGDGDGDGVL